MRSGVRQNALWLLVCGLSAMLVACDQGSPGDRFPPRSVEVAAGCDPLLVCRVENGGLSVEVRMGPDIHALQPFLVQLDSGNDLDIAEILVAFSMRGMDMGWNRYRLETDGAGGWQAQVTLPICVSGRSDWLADFEISAAGQRLQFSVPFILQK